MSVKYDTVTWNIIEKFFYDNPQVLVKHHIDSYNDFFRTGLKSILKEKNPIIFQKEQNQETKEFNYRCELQQLFNYKVPNKLDKQIHENFIISFDNNFTETNEITYNSDYLLKINLNDK